ncbi:hypothetical protein PENNAL_c0060G03101 [Penicillium nalgiovense]|uniref:Uncharacterized protein n=1 Tax=Penicillium nalgiovense TaxID=60175 RepID=A0A1V6XQS7_PENNA|nr:hypothetical protein PENNAL_c0060G03101 [Penicillium nalgiovense]
MGDFSKQVFGPTDHMGCDLSTKCLSATGTNGYSLSENQHLPFNEVPPNQGNKPNRGLPRRRSRYNIERIGDKITPALFRQMQAPPILLQGGSTPTSPEDKPASLSAIKDAVQSSHTNNSENGDQTRLDPGSAMSAHRITNVFQTHRRTGSRPASTTSAGSSASDSSHQSVTSGLSNGS